MWQASSKKSFTWRKTSKNIKALIWASRAFRDATLHVYMMTLKITQGVRKVVLCVRYTILQPTVQQSHLCYFKLGHPNKEPVVCNVLSSRSALLINFLRNRGSLKALNRSKLISKESDSVTPWSLRITLVSFRPNLSAALSILALAKYGLQPEARTSCWGQLDLDGGLSWY